MEHNKEDNRIELSGVNLASLSRRFTNHWCYPPIRVEGTAPSLLRPKRRVILFYHTRNRKTHRVLIIYFYISPSNLCSE